MFSNLDRWDVALLVIAVYVAVYSLVRLMNLRREQLLEQFRGEVERDHAQRTEIRSGAVRDTP